MRLVFISDTHQRMPVAAIPEGDILIHCGDGTNMGSLLEIARLGEQLRALPHKWVLFIAGNHDWGFQKMPDKARRLIESKKVCYVQDNLWEAEGLRIYGSPWQPMFYDWAFNLPRGGTELREKWAKIPEDLDILVTHGPPMYILDRNEDGTHVGCELLREAVEHKKPAIHAFGHVHEGYGIVEKPDTVYINASICDLHYRPVNKPVVMEIP